MRRRARGCRGLAAPVLLAGLALALLAAPAGAQVDNAAPTSAAATVTTNEDEAHTFVASDFAFTDTDTGDALASVKVVTLPAVGALELDETAVTLNQAVPKADIDAGKLKYTPVANGHGSAYATFIFKVNDGTVDSVSVYAITVDVMAVNDPATGAPAISGTARTGRTALSVSTTGIADVDGLTGVTYSYQWVRVDTSNAETDIDDATSSTYTPVADDAGNKLKVKVTFTDNDGTEETLASEPTATVTTTPGMPQSFFADTGDSRALLTWAAPASDGGESITRYEYRHAAAASVPDATSWTSSGTNLEARLTGLTNDAAHAFEVRAVNPVGDGPPATTTATPQAATCDAPTYGGRRQIWTGSVTVSSLTDPLYGFKSGTGTLSDTTFSIGSSDFTIDEASVSTATKLHFSLNGTLTAAQKAALTLHVCDVAFTFSTADLTAASHTYAWTDSSIDWSLLGARTLYLSLPENNAATGTPTISSAYAGNIHVGRSLTVNTSAVADDDGLTSATLTYKWIRVASNSNETTISGATSASYTPVDADLGHTLKVKVSFTDDFGTAESRESAQTAEVEVPTLTVEAADADEGDALSFTVTLSLATDQEVTASWAVSTSGTANTASSADLSGTTSGSLTFAADETSKTIAVNTVEDSIHELDETFTVTLSSPSSNARLGAAKSAVGTIDDDDDAPVVVLVFGDNSMSENGGTLEVHGGFANNMDNPTSATLTVRIAPVAGAFTVSGDGTISIPAGAQSSGGSSVTLTAVDNDTDSPDRTVTVTATVESDLALTFAAPAGRDITLTDDEVAPTVTLNLAPPSIRESDVTGTPGDQHVSTMTASLSHPSSEDTTIDVSASAVSPAVSGDFALSTNKRLTVAAGQTASTGTVTITAADNNVDAPDKSLTVSGDAANTQGITEPDDATLTIRDDEEAPKVTLSLTSNSISENGGTTTVTATLDNPSSADTVVTIAPVAGAFTVSGTLTIPAGQTSDDGAATLTAVDNETDAPDRTVTVTASAANSQGAVAPDDATLTLTDDDPAPVVTLVLTPSPIRESDDPSVAGNQHVATVTATLDRPSSNSTSLTLSAAAVSPAVSGDFTLSTNRGLTIAIGATTSSGTVRITAVDNNIDAPDKSVTVSAIAINTHGITAPSDATLTIADDEATPTVTLTLSQTEADEDDSTAITVTASLDHPSSQGTTIEVNVDALPGADDEDVAVSENRTLTIAARQTASTGTVTFVPVDNETDSPDKRMTVTATVSNSNHGGNGANVPTGVVFTIKDDDPAPVATLVLTPSTIGENSGSTTVTVTLDRPSSESTTVTVAAAAVSPAVSGDLTLSANKELTVAAGQTESTGTVTIDAVDNDTDAPDKTVTVSAAASNVQGIKGSGATPGTANIALADRTLTIEDDELPPTVTLTLDDSSIRESDDDSTTEVEEHQTTVTATLSHPSSEATTVTITAAPGDFTLSASGRLTIPAGATDSSAAVTLTAVDDNIDAPDKSLQVSATAVNTQGIVQPATAALAIEDEEPAPTVTITLSSSSIDEDGGSATVEATLSHPSSAQTTVTVSGAPEGAAEDTDFTVAGSVMTILAGAVKSTGTATVSAVDNNVDAPDKQVTISGTVINDQGYESGTPADLTLAIPDDELPPTVTLHLSQSSISEDGGEATVTARLSHPSSEATAVTVSAAAVSPAADGDFTLTGAQLTVAAGLTASTGTVTVTANDNDVDTANKKVTISATATNSKEPTPSLSSTTPTAVTLTIADDDTRGLVVTPETVVVREGKTNSYTVALRSAPTEDVTVTVSPASGSMLTVAAGSSPLDADFAATATLTFSSSNWSTDQTVTMKAATDTGRSDENHTIRHTAAGGDYAGVSASLAVIQLDALGPTAKLILTVDRTEIAEGGGAAVLKVTVSLAGLGRQEYSVALRAAPGSGSNAASASDFTANTATVQIGGTFNYNDTYQTTQQIAVTPVDDGIDENDENFVVTATVTGGTLPVTSATVTIADDDSRGVTVSVAQIELDEGGSRDYTVVLDSQPTGPVTVTPALQSGADPDLTLPTTPLTFSADNWSTEQTVTVTAAEDDDALDDQATVSHTVAGADYGANNVRAASVQVTANDNDGRGVTVSTRDLTVEEAGTATYTVVLNSAPTGTVTVRPRTSGDSDVTVSPTSLTFTTSNWSTVQTVTVSAAQDADTADDRAAVSHAVSGADYGARNVQAPEVKVLVNDNGEASNTATLSAAPASFAEAKSGSTKVTATVDGAARATSTAVTVLVRGGTAEVSDFVANPSAFTLTIAAGSKTGSATFRFRAVDDDIDEDDETVTVSGSASGLTLSDATITIEDDDEKGVILTQSSLTATEQGSDGRYKVSLRSQPTGTVTVTTTVTPSVPGDTDVTTIPATLTFTAANWLVQQTVTVRVAGDPDGDDEGATISHAVSGADYTGVTAGTVAVTVRDDDEASQAVELSVSPDRVDENVGSETVTLTARLDGAARTTDTDVAVTVSSGTAEVVTDFTAVSGFTLTIAAGDTEATETISFSPENDSLDEGDETVTIGGTAAGLRVDEATLTIIDDDDRGVSASVAALTVDEEGTATYTVVLDTQPTGPVRVTPSVAGNSEVTVSPSQPVSAGDEHLEFTPSNWDTPQEVTVSAADDADAADDTATLRHAVSGADYGGVKTPEVAVTVRDTDTRGISMSAPSVQFREGGSETYTVVLDTQPTGTVTVKPSVSGDSDVTVSPSRLRFTASNWNRPQTVTVKAGQDLDEDRDNAVVQHEVSGADYGDAGTTAPSVRVTVTDDDVPSTAISLAISPTEVGESAGRTRLTVTATLDASPRDVATEVELTLGSGADGATPGDDFVEIDPVTLTIPAGRPSATATVSLEPVRDDLDEGAGETVQVRATTDSGLALLDGSGEALPADGFTVTIADDDTRGIALSRRTLTVKEEGSATWTVRLTSQPEGEVTVSLSVTGNSDVSVEPESLTFTASNWNAARTVTARAAEDPDGDDDTATVVHDAPGYLDDPVELPVTVDDIDPPSRSVQLSLDPALVDENVGSRQVTVTATLDGAARAADTVIALVATGGTATAVTDFAALTGATVTIPANATSGSGTFTFSPVDDSVDEGLSETVVLGGTTAGLTVRTATLTIADDDGRGIVLSPRPSQGPVNVTEDDAAGTPYTVALATLPTGTVTVRVTVSGNRNVTVSPASLTFTADTWDTTQMVKVSAAHDDDAADDTAQLQHAASGADYGSTRALPLAVAVTDDDEQAVTVSESTLEFREGGRATYTVVLETRPEGTVTVTPTVTGDSDISVSPSSLSFTASNWNRPKTVTVTAGQDLDQTADTATVNHTVAGADYGAEGVTAAAVEVTVSDDDIPSTEIRLSLSTDAVREDGGSTRLTVTAELDAAPEMADTVVTLTLEAGTATAGDDYEEVTTPATLTIPAGRASATAQVALTPVADAIDEDDETVRIAASTTSSLTLTPSSLEVTIEDDDQRGIRVTPTSLTVLEGTEGATYTVALTSQPTATVTVTPSVTGSTGTRSVTVAPSSLTFTASDWNSAQTVTVSAANDDVVRSDATAEVTHGLSGGDYGSETAESVSVSVPGLFIDGMTVTLTIPDDGVVTVPAGTPVPVGVRVVFQAAVTGGTVAISAAEGAAALSNPPRGFDTGDAAVDIELGGGATLSGTATVCLPHKSGGRGLVFRYDEGASEWVELDEPAGGPPAGLACGVTDQFSLFAVGSSPNEAVAKAWLARFGRTLAQQVVDAVQDRMAAPRTAGVEGVFAGHALSAGRGVEPGTGGDWPSDEGVFPPLRPGSGATGGTDEFGASYGATGDASSRALTARELLMTSRFTLTGEGADGTSHAIWGRGATTRFDGREGEASVEGRVTTAFLGADWATDRLLMGFALSRSDGEGSWRQDGEEAKIRTKMTGLHPYLGYEVSDRLSLWGTAGFGWGSLSLPDGRARIDSGIGMKMVAAGARGDLVPQGDESGMTLALKTDGLFLRIRAHGAEGLEAVEAEVSRVRLALESSLAMETAYDGTLTPSFEIGVRHDGGDAETGVGTDVGAGLVWSDPATGIEVDIRGRGLLNHQEDHFRERGISGSLTLNPEPSSERGLAVSLTQSFGGSATGGADTLFARETMAGIAANDDDGDGSWLDRRRFEATVGYGLPALGGRFTSTPQIGLGLSDTERDYSLGWRLRLARRDLVDLSIGLEGTRRESANDDREPENRIGFGLRLRR